MIDRTAQGFVLIAPNGLIDYSSLSVSRGGAQFTVVGTPGDDGRLHTWGWRCKSCVIQILSLELIEPEGD